MTTPESHTDLFTFNRLGHLGQIAAVRAMLASGAPHKDTLRRATIIGRRHGMTGRAIIAECRGVNIALAAK